jgi:catechol 2,3-dioxygenase-like lactoylglutathione lyase family enzyme
LKIVSIAGFAVISRDPAPSSALYRDLLGLPMKAMDDYIYVDRFPGAHHFGVWPLRMAAQSCFGSDEWPGDVPEPQVTVEFELEDIESVGAAVEEMKAKGHSFVHESRMEPWGQTIARFMSPEGVLVGLSYAPWLHEDRHQ